jgi:hypothetical protein
VNELRRLQQDAVRRVEERPRRGQSSTALRRVATAASAAAPSRPPEFTSSYATEDAPIEAEDEDADHVQSDVERFRALNERCGASLPLSRTLTL